MNIYMSKRLANTLLGLTILGLSELASAQDGALNLNLPSQSAQSLQLASNVATTNLPPSATHATPTDEFKPPLFSGDKLHEYLGLSTLVVAGLTALTAPSCERCTYTAQNPRPVNGTHATLGKTAGVLAVSTVVSGLIDHWDDFHLDDGWSDPDNLHVLLGAAGALTMAYAVNKSANSSTPTSHAGLAELGAAAMLIAVKLTW